MSALDNSGGAITEFGRLTANTVTTIFTATNGSTWVRSITATERSGATPTLTIEVYDVTNTTSYYKRYQVTMAAGTEVVHNEPFSLPGTWAVRLTSNNASGLIDWTITYEPNAGKLR